MPTKPRVGSSDAAHGVAKTTAYRFAGALDGVGRSAGSTAEAVGGGQLLIRASSSSRAAALAPPPPRSWASSSSCSSSLTRRL